MLIYLEEKWGKTVGDQFQDKINEAIGVLSVHPYIGAASDKLDARGLLITNHNKLFYRVKGDSIVIISLMDARRKNYPY